VILPLAHPEALSLAARRLASTLAARPWSGAFYLAGSAALGLYLGHRTVGELDLMTATNTLAGPERRDLLTDLLSIDPATEVETARDGYLFVRLAGGVGARLFHYPYPLVDPGSAWQGLAVASAVDLGLMKLGAIISRGSRRDFVDLYLLCRALPLPLLLGRAGEKFGHVRDFPLQALKGLADLTEVGADPMPRLTQPLTWSEVESWLQATVQTLAGERLGLGAPAVRSATQPVGPPRGGAGS
jgi:hypothetical protein